MSYAAIYRAAVRESLRAELAAALGEIERATHAAVDRRDGTRVFWYGTLAACEAFASGIGREVAIAPMTVELKELTSAAKVRAYRGCRSPAGGW